MRESSVAATLLGLVVVLALPSRSTAADCETIRARSAPNMTVTEAVVVPAGQFSPDGPGGTVPARAAKLRAFCRVTARLTPTADSNITIEVWMPVEGWNGRFVGVGNSGYSSELSYVGLMTSLERGYAVAATDTGHTGGDPSWLGHPEKLTDWGYRAVHEMTAAAKAFVRAFYGAAPRFSYWNGCSTGGRQGLMEAQRFPADYDGIIAGAPTNNWTSLMTGMLSISRTMLDDPAGRVPAEKFAVLNRAVLNACDSRDGVTDDVIEDPLTCRFDPGVLACKNGDGPDCLTASQIDVARKIYGGTTNPRTGDSLFPGRPLGSELGWAWPAERTEPPGLLTSHFKHVVFEDPNWDFRTFDFDRDYTRAQAVDSGRLTAVSPDLNAFISRGGKLMMFHGWNDMDITAYNSMNYFESVRSAIGASGIENSVRLFMAPGMGHCNGALGPRQTEEWLTALEAWVERGVAPNQIIVSRLTNNVVDRTRLLCAYPQVARYSGQGSTDDAANFSCVAPDAKR